LTSLFSDGAGYSAVNTARSALSTFLRNDQGHTIGKSLHVKRFMKGVFKLRPPLPRYSHIWNANVVLDFLRFFDHNDENIPLSYLTYKLVMLLALSTAQRAQTLHELLISDMIIGEKLVIIPMSSLLKHTTQSSRRYTIELRAYDVDPDICVVDVLKTYLNKTEKFRNGINKLFISFHKPHKAVSRETISRWLNSVLREAGIDVNIFKAHSTRAASCAKYKMDKVPVDEIMKKAGWKSNMVYKKFYDKCLMESHT